MHGYKWPINCTRTRTSGISSGTPSTAPPPPAQHGDSIGNPQGVGAKGQEKEGARMSDENRESMALAGLRPLLGPNHARELQGQTPMEEEGVNLPAFAGLSPPDPAGGLQHTSAPRLVLLV